MHVLSNIVVKPSDNYLTCVIIPWFTDFTLMFMVVSGFSLCCGYYERMKTGNITSNSFYKKRYLRILPFFACLCTIYSFNANIATAEIGRTNIIYTMPLFMSGGMIYLYRDKVIFYGLNQWLFLVFCLILTVGFFMYPEMRKTAFGALLAELLLFGAWLIYALGSKDVVLNNRIVKFISGISMEVYLCHMVIYRVVERVHFENYIGNENFLYAFTCVLVIAGAIIFSWLMKKYILPYSLRKVNIRV